MCAALAYPLVNKVEESFTIMKMLPKKKINLTSRLFCRAMNGEPECSYQDVKYK